MEYSPLIATDSVSINSFPIEVQNNNPIDNHDHLCRSCKNKLIKKQPTTHKPMDCLSQRCEVLENEVIRLKDHDMKSRLQIKELQNQIQTLENVIKGLTAPKLEQAAPYSLGISHKLRHQLKKSNSDHLPAHKSEVNYDNILQPKRSNSRERVGLFGSLGALSQR